MNRHFSCGLGILFLLSVAAPTRTAAQSATQSMETRHNWTAENLIFEPNTSFSEDFQIYHFFHKSGISRDQASQNFGECNVYRQGPKLEPGSRPNTIPRRVSLFEDQAYVPYVHNPNDNLVVDVISAIAGGFSDERSQALRLRKCMEYKGYDRYGLSKDLWLQIMDVPDADRVRINASIASGPTPETAKLLP